MRIPISNALGGSWPLPKVTVFMGWDLRFCLVRNQDFQPIYSRFPICKCSMFGLSILGGSHKMIVQKVFTQNYKYAKQQLQLGKQSG